MTKSRQAALRVNFICHCAGALPDTIPYAFMGTKQFPRNNIIIIRLEFLPGVWPLLHLQLRVP